MPGLPEELYTSAKTQTFDKLAIKTYKIPGFRLMQRAGAAAFTVMIDTFPSVKQIVVFCGRGNNGGDGYVLAKCAAEAGLIVTVVQLGDHSRLVNDALLAYEQCQKSKVKIVKFDKNKHVDADLIVDALLGTGVCGEITGDCYDAIAMMNAHKADIFAIDVPSGLNPDTGASAGISVMAAACITFIGLKQGLLTGIGPDCCGSLFFNDLHMPKDLYQQIAPSAYRLTPACINLSKRRPCSHKGLFGHVLVVGGDYGYFGAVRLSAMAALRSGCGLVTVATRKENALSMAAAYPEIMTAEIEDQAALERLMARASVLVVGPGLGQSAWGQAALQTVLTSPLPKVIDADALNLLAKKPVVLHNAIITPHPGEAKRLSAEHDKPIQECRFQCVAHLAECYQAVVVLKGAGTLIKAFDSDAIYLCDAGNPGMATAGMGDILTGVIAAMLAQQLSLLEAAKAGVMAHALAGDQAARSGERGLIASDLLDYLRDVVNA